MIWKPGWPKNNGSARARQDKWCAKNGHFQGQLQNVAFGAPTCYFSHKLQHRPAVSRASSKMSLLETADRGCVRGRPGRGLWPRTRRRCRANDSLGLIFAGLFPQRLGETRGLSCRSSCGASTCRLPGGALAPAEAFFPGVYIKILKCENLPFGAPKATFWSWPWKWPFFTRLYGKMTNFSSSAENCSKSDILELALEVAVLR